MKCKRCHPAAFGLLEVLVMIGVFALVVVLSYPGYKRSGLLEKARYLKEELTQIEGALAVASKELKAPPGSLLTFDQIKKYLPHASRLQKTGLDPFGHPYGNQRNDAKPTVPSKSAEQLRGVVPEDYWGGSQVSGEL